MEETEKMEIYNRKSNDIKNFYMNQELKNNTYVGLRIIEVICIAVFTFGFLWEGTELLKLSLPEFMMLYGGLGALISELFARFINRKIKKKE